MVFLTTGRLDPAEIRRRTMASNPAYAALLNTNLDGVYHFRKLTAPTARMHARIIARWKRYVEDPDVDHFDGPPLSADVAPGASFPTLGQCKNFFVWLLGETTGMLDKAVTLSTARSYVWTFLAVWRQEACAEVPKLVNRQLTAFIESKDLNLAVPLSTKARPKNVASTEDVDQAIWGIWHDRTHFRTHRMRLQMMALVSITAITGGRIGSIIESHCYRGSNQAIQWQDVEFYIDPNPANPAEPFVFILLTLRYIKGNRDKEAAVQRLFLVPETAPHQMSCPVMALLALAIEDGALQGIDRPEQVFFPDTPPTKRHCLSINPSHKCQPVLRDEVFNTENGWTISPTRALPYSRVTAHLRWLSLFLGFPDIIRTYDYRRGSAQRLSRLVSEPERMAQMTHITKEMYLRYYHGMTSFLHLQGLFRSDTQDQATVQMFHASQQQTAMADRAAPCRLSVAARAELESEPELVQLREQIAQVQDKIRGCNEIISSPADPSTKDAAHAALRSYQEVALGLQAERNKIFHREARARLDVARKQFFSEASFRQLNPSSAESSTETHTMAARAYWPVSRGPFQEPPSSEPSTSSPGGTGGGGPSSARDAIDDLIHMLYHPEEDTGIAVNLVKAVNAYLALPHRQYVPCYRGESPTSENKCPGCGEECNQMLGQNPGEHIHGCLGKMRKRQADALAEHNYRPQKCPWSSCRRASVTWATRALLLSHFASHINQAYFQKAASGVPQCLWQDADGERCDEAHLDLEYHIAQQHGFNVSGSIAVKYCYICSEWFEDFEGTTWEEHCVGHYADLFLPFSERAGLLPHIEPEGIKFTDPVDNAIDFENGSGFHGRFPEFHGDVYKGIALAPMFCPFCVYDKAKRMSVRMQQFSEAAAFVIHLRTHCNPEDDANFSPGVCPVPACGTHRYPALHDLLVHMITVHRVPICGSSKHTTIRRLKLPKFHTLDEDTSLPLGHADQTTTAPLSSVSPLPSSTSSKSRTKRRVRQILTDDEDEHSENILMEMDDACPNGSTSPSSSVAAVLGSNNGRKRRKRAASGNEPGEDSQNIVAQAPKSKRGPPKIVGRCSGCHMVRQDIDKHLATIAFGTKKGCAEKSSYRLVIDGKDHGGTIKWEAPPGVQIKRGGNSQGDRFHLCIGCRHQFVDIREHFADGCDKSQSQKKRLRFKIREPGAKRSTWGPLLDFEEWIKGAPPLANALDSKRFKCNGCARRYADIDIHVKAVGPTSLCRDSGYSILSPQGEWIQQTDEEISQANGPPGGAHTPCMDDSIPQRRVVTGGALNAIAPTTAEASIVEATMDTMTQETVGTIAFPDPPLTPSNPLRLAQSPPAQGRRLPIAALLNSPGSPSISCSLGQASQTQSRNRLSINALLNSPELPSTSRSPHSVAQTSYPRIRRLSMNAILNPSLATTERHLGP